MQVIVIREAGNMGLGIEKGASKLARSFGESESLQTNVFMYFQTCDIVKRMKISICQFQLYRNHNYGLGVYS